MNEIVIFGWATGSKAQLHNRRTAPTAQKVLWNAVIIIGLYTAYGLFRWYSSGRADWDRIAMMAAAVMVGSVLPLWRIRRTRELPGPVLVRLSGRGFVQRDGVGSAVWKPWVVNDQVVVVAEGNGSYRLRIERPAPSHLFDVPAVDITFDSDAESVEVLQSRLARLRDVATAAGA